MFKTCEKCGNIARPEDFPKCGSIFMGKRLPFCDDCLCEIIPPHSDLEKVDKFCQWADIAFVPAKWAEAVKDWGERAIAHYCAISGDQYENVDWGKMNEEWKKLQKEKKLEDSMPELRKKRIEELSKIWQGQYTLDELEFLNQSFQDLTRTFTITPGITTDQARKLCKISLLIDQRIRAGGDFDKLLKSYDTLIKIGGFSSENAKNTSDFESIGELCAYLEKKGFMNKFYDGVKRDVVDETMANISANNKRWILNETNIQDEANKKLAALKLSKLQEEEIDYDKYETSTDFLDEEDYDDEEDFFNPEA